MGGTHSTRTRDDKIAQFQSEDLKERENLFDLGKDKILLRKLNRT